MTERHWSSSWGLTVQSRSRTMRQLTGEGGEGMEFGPLPTQLLLCTFPNKVTSLDPFKQFHQLQTKDSNTFPYGNILLQATSCSKHNTLMKNSLIIILKTGMVFSHCHLITEWICIIIISSTEKSDVKKCDTNIWFVSFLLEQSLSISMAWHL